MRHGSDNSRIGKCQGPAAVGYFLANKRTTVSRLTGKTALRHSGNVSQQAKSQRAIEMHIHSTSGIDPERTDKLLSRLGFKTYGGNYAVGLG